MVEVRNYVRKVIIMGVVSLLILCIVLLLAQNPVVGSNITEDIGKYLQVNTYVENHLKRYHAGFLPPFEIINQDTAYYYYSYNCALFGDPNYLIYLENTFSDNSSLICEQERIVAISSRSISIDNNQTLYIAKDIQNDISLYTDDKIRDGLSFVFEIAIINKKLNKITYLSTLQQDNNQKDKRIIEILGYIDGDKGKTGDGSLS